MMMMVSVVSVVLVLVMMVVVVAGLHGEDRRDGVMQKGRQSDKGFVFSFSCHGIALPQCANNFQVYKTQMLAALDCLRRVSSRPAVLVVSHARLVATEHIPQLDNIIVDKTMQDFGTLSKAFAMLSSPFNHSVFLDADTCVISSAIEDYFKQLQYFDFVSVWECCGVFWGTTGPPTEEILNGGYEPQTGIFGLRRSARELMNRWIEEYKSKMHFYDQVSSRDQQALVRTLQANPSFRHFTLPARYNFRWESTSFSSIKPLGMTPITSNRDGIVAMHSHRYDSLDASARALKAAEWHDRDPCECAWLISRNFNCNRYHFS